MPTQRNYHAAENKNSPKKKRVPIGGARQPVRGIGCPAHDFGRARKCRGGDCHKIPYPKRNTAAGQALAAGQAAASEDEDAARVRLCALSLMASRTGSSRGRGGAKAAISKAGGKSAATSKARGAAAISKAGSTLAKLTGLPEDDPVLKAAVKRRQESDAFITQFMQKTMDPTPIPGWSYMDVLGGTKGCEWGGHSIHDMEDTRLKDPKLHGRCQAWMPLSLADLKAACKKHSLLLEGSKKVLALRLAIKAPKAKP